MSTMSTGRKLACLSVTSLLASCGAESEADVEAVFEVSECDFDPPEGQEDFLECGSVVVPEDPNNPKGATIRLRVAVIRATGENPAPDPLVYLSGGPGGPSIASPSNMQYFSTQFAADFQATRDLVFWDLRGTGRTEPKLDCPEYGDAFLDALPKHLTAEEDAAGWIEGLHSCHDRWLQEGIRFNTYNSKNMVADLQLVMRALGYESWNLYGISYGTRVALTALREDPDPIRSVILDSVDPLQVTVAADLPSTIQRSLDRLFADCLADGDCATDYPNLEKRFYALIPALNQTPLEISLADPRGGDPIRAMATGDRLLLALHQALYATSLLPLLPFAIDGLAEGNASVAALGTEGALASLLDFAQVASYSITCAEETPFLTQEAVDEASSGVPEVLVGMASYDAAVDLAVCEFWQTKPLGAIENQPVTSAVPALIFAGDYDPITPPRYGQRAAETLSQSQYFEFRGRGHGVLRSEADAPGCAAALLADFLYDPTATLDGSCLDKLGPPDFL